MTSTPVPLAVLDIDGDGELVALTDGLLVVRWLFNLTGAALVGGAVDTSDCTRCAAMEIELYLASIELLLDIDGDGQRQALTDGLLVLRYLFGLRGDVLIAGVVDTANCTRCEPEEIEDYIEVLLGPPVP